MGISVWVEATGCPAGLGSGASDNLKLEEKLELAITIEN